MFVLSFLSIAVIWAASSTIVTACGGHSSPNIEVSSPDAHDIIVTYKLAPCREATPEDISTGHLPPPCLRIEGIAWVDERESEGAITNVWITLTHETQGPLVFNDHTSDPVVIERPLSVRTRWHFDWEVGMYDGATDDFRYQEGEWTLQVRAFDGKNWSDDPARDGRVVEKVLLIEHGTPCAIPTLVIDAGRDVNITIGHNDSGPTVPRWYQAMTMHLFLTMIVCVPSVMTSASVAIAAKDIRKGRYVI
jgi:hypothetical protein